MPRKQFQTYLDNKERIKTWILTAWQCVHGQVRILQMTIFQQPSNASGSISFYELSALVISGCALGQTIKKLHFLHTDEAQHDYLLYDRQLL